MTIMKQVQNNKLGVAACLCFFGEAPFSCQPSANLQPLEYGYLWRVLY